MSKLFETPISRLLLASVLLLFLQPTANAQEETVIDNKGNIVEVRNTVVTTATAAPVTPVQNDIWFDTTADLTKIYDGTTWVIINADALASKENATNKSTDVTLSDATNTEFPTELAVKSYVDGQIASTADDDITAVSFDGTDLKVDEGSTTFSADLSDLRDHDWYREGGSDPATNVNQDIYTMGNVGIGTNNPQRRLHVVGNNSVIRLSRASNTATLIFDRYSGSVDNTLKSFQLGLNASGIGTGEFFIADYNENVNGAEYTQIMTFTDGNEVIRFNQYGDGNFDSNGYSRLLGAEVDGDIVEVDISNFDIDASDDFSGDYDDLTNKPTSTSIYTIDGTLTSNRSLTQNNFDLNFDANTLVVSGDDNRVGIGTANPTAQLDIESTGVPLEIKPSPSTPTGTQPGQIFMGDDGILYAYDGNRSKWLSVDRNLIGWGRSSGSTSNEYLRQFNGSPSNLNGWRIIRDATMTGITVQTGGIHSWTLEIRKNNVLSPITSFTIVSSNGAHNNNLNIDLNEGDFLQAYLNGLAVSHPQALIEIAWRK